MDVLVLSETMLKSKGEYQFGDMTRWKSRGGRNGGTE